MAASPTAYAIIPARGGSKRIPGKNIRDFLGLPILTRIIETLQSSELFEEIYVSSDDDEIIDLARDSGVAVPFVRPAHLAGDFSTTAEVANHAITWLIDAGANSWDHFLVAYPTAVMMTSQHLSESRLLLAPGTCDFVFAGARFPSEIERSWRKDDSHFVEPAWPGHQKSRSQDFQPAYYDAGQFYWSTSTGWDSDVVEEGKRRRVYEIDPLEAVDINTEDDWIRSEKLFRLLRKA